MMGTDTNAEKAASKPTMVMGTIVSISTQTLEFEIKASDNRFHKFQFARAWRRKLLYAMVMNMTVLVTVNRSHRGVFEECWLESLSRLLEVNPPEGFGMEEE